MDLEKDDKPLPSIPTQQRNEDTDVPIFSAMGKPSVKEASVSINNLQQSQQQPPAITAPKPPPRSNVSSAHQLSGPANFASSAASLDRPLSGKKVAPQIPRKPQELLSSGAMVNGKGPIAPIRGSAISMRKHGSNGELRGSNEKLQQSGSNRSLNNLNTDDENRRSQASIASNTSATSSAINEKTNSIASSYSVASAPTITPRSGRVASLIGEFERKPANDQSQSGGFRASGNVKTMSGSFQNKEFIERLAKQLEGSSGTTSSKHQSQPPPQATPHSTKTRSASDAKVVPIISPLLVSVNNGDQKNAPKLGTIRRAKEPNKIVNTIHEGMFNSADENEDKTISTAGDIHTHVPGKLPSNLVTLLDSSLKGKNNSSNSLASPSTPSPQLMSPPVATDSSSNLPSPPTPTSPEKPDEKSLKSSKKASASNLKEFSPFTKKQSKKVADSTISRTPAAPVQPKAKWYDQIDPAAREELLSKMTKEEKMRQDIAWEILTTEEDYIKDLEQVISVYIKPIQEQKLLPKMSDISELFSNLEQLLPVNKVFIEGLKKCRKDSLMDGVGVAFLAVADFFKIYTMYCGNHGKAVTSLQKSMKTDNTLKAFFKEVYTRPDFNGLNLESYLLKPVQRICKYPLLIRELVKNTPEEHKDRKSLETAKGKIDAIVATVNERTKHIEVMSKTLEVIQKIKGGKDLHIPTLRYFHDGDIIMRHGSDPDNVYKKYHLFLFNEIIIITKPPKLLQRDKFHIYDKVDTKNLVFGDVPDEEALTNSLVIIKQDIEQCYVIVCGSPQDKQKWLAEMERCGIHHDNAKALAAISKLSHSRSQSAPPLELAGSQLSVLTTESASSDTTNRGEKHSRSRTDPNKSISMLSEQLEAVDETDNIEEDESNSQMEDDELAEVSNPDMNE